MNTPLVRLTFNSPALRTYFGDDPAGIRVRVTDKGAVLIKPATMLNNWDCLEMVARGERGKQIILADEMSQTILDALTGKNDINTHPYFTLTMEKQGWIKLEHYTDDDARLIRVVPHVRLWIPQDAPVLDAAPAELPEFRVMVEHFVERMKDPREVKNFAERLKDAHKLVGQHPPGKRGRPRADIVQARDNLQNFEQFYKMVSEGPKQASA